MRDYITAMCPTDTQHSLLHYSVLMELNHCYKGLVRTQHKETSAGYLRELISKTTGKTLSTKSNIVIVDWGIMELWFVVLGFLKWLFVEGHRFHRICY